MKSYTYINKNFSFFKLFIILVISTLCITGCNPSDGSDAAGSNPTAETRIVIDSLGREVEIPMVIETIIPLGNTPRMITYLQLADKAVGIGSLNANKITPVTAYAYANRELWKDIPHVGTDAGGARDYYPEQIIALNPDVILCTYPEDLANEIQNKTGIPVIAVPMGTLFESDFNDALLMIGDICGVTERAEEVIAYIDRCLTDLQTRTEGIPEENKPSILGAAATYKGVHGIDSVYSRYPVFEAIAAKDVAIGVSDFVGGVMIDKEMILSWDPEYIMLDSGGVPLVQEDYKENPEYFKQLQAVTNNNIYMYPSSTSYYSNVEIPLVNSYYVASIIYPEAFEDISFEDKANEIFKFFLGEEHYVETLQAFGAGYLPMDLGELDEQ
jgi:iron complex transport system substrate-binding protein